MELINSYFYFIFAAFAIITITMFYFFGINSEKIFPSIESQTVVFREKGASGYSFKNAITKMGGANKVLDIIVTNNELWIKGIYPMFTFVGTKYDLTHKIPLKNINSVELNANKIIR